MFKNIAMKFGGVAIAAAIGFGYMFFNPSGYSKNDIGEFVEGTLDSFYVGAANETYKEMLSVTDGVVMSYYTESVDVEVDNIMYIYGLDLIDGVQVLDIDSKLTTAVKTTLFPKTSYEVTNVELKDDVYSVTVTVNPVLYGEAIDTRLEVFAQDPAVMEMTDKEFYDKATDEIVAAMTDAAIGEPESFEVLVSADATDTWGIDEDTIYPVYDSIVTYIYE